MTYVDRDYPEDQVYGTPEPVWNPGVYRWADLWERSNPNPCGPDSEEWYEAYELMCDRAWIAHILPVFHVWDWDDEDVRTLRKLMSHHVCGVCGRVDDHGCAKGC